MRSADEIEYRLLGDDLQAVVITLDPGEGVIAETGSMMDMQDGVRMATTMDPSGRRGGVFDKLLGAGKRLLTGESFFMTMYANTGCLVAFQESVSYDIEMVSGIKTALFGGDGLFFARLAGPGRVVLQTLPFSRLADRIIAASPRMGGQSREEGSGLGMLGRVLDGDNR